MGYKLTCAQKWHLLNSLTDLTNKNIYFHFMSQFFHLKIRSSDFPLTQVQTSVPSPPHPPSICLPCPYPVILLKISANGRLSVVGAVVLTCES